jgi:hypothetical protein
LNEFSEGIIVQSLKYLFHYIENDKYNQWDLLLSFYQLYMDKIQDLFNPTNKNLSIREDHVSFFNLIEL